MAQSHLGPSRPSVLLKRNVSRQAHEDHCRKESKAADYAPCDAYWLLIVVDWADPAQDQEITTTGLKLPSEVFEKIIVYKPGFEDIAEVKL
jgi:hypothetical protein